MSNRNDQASVSVPLGKQELLALLNALNETMEAIEDWEFSTRVGCQRSDIEELQRKLGRYLDQVG